MDTTIENEKIRLELSLENVMLLCNSMNEVCNGFRLSEFEKKIGTNKVNTEIILQILSKSFDKADKLTDEKMHSK